MKEKIQEIIIVEGKHDTARLKQFFDCETYETGGDSLTEKELDVIEAMAKKRGIIVFTDPDSPGEHIRRLIQQRVPEAKHAFIDKKKARTEKKVGIEHAGRQDLWESLEHCVTFVPDQQSLAREDYIDLGLHNSQARRDIVCAAFHIGPCNSKTCWKRLNAMGIEAKQIAQVLEEAA